MNTYMSVPTEARRRHQIPGARVIGGCESPDADNETKLGSAGRAEPENNPAPRPT